MIAMAVRAITPVNPVKTAPKKGTLLDGYFDSFLSIKGSTNKKNTASVGTITVPTIKNFPWQYFKSSNKNRKYHSGLARKLDAGSAGAWSSAPPVQKTTP